MPLVTTGVGASDEGETEETRQQGPCCAEDPGHESEGQRKWFQMFVPERETSHRGKSHCSDFVPAHVCSGCRNKVHRLALKQWKLLSCAPGGSKSTIRASAALVSPGASPLGWQVAASRRVLAWSPPACAHPCRLFACVLISSPWRDTSHIGLGPC